MKISFKKFGRHEGGYKMREMHILNYIYSILASKIEASIQSITYAGLFSRAGVNEGKTQRNAWRITGKVGG